MEGDQQKRATRGQLVWIGIVIGIQLGWVLSLIIKAII
jgi:hypothetical protein